MTQQRITCSMKFKNEQTKKTVHNVAVTILFILIFIIL